jgi:SOS-response transcriptional repressor LexA
MPQYDAALIQRMLEVSGAKNITELARHMEVTPAAFTGYKKRGAIPARLLFRFSERFGVSMDWLSTGAGSPRQGTFDRPPSEVRVVVPEEAGRELREWYRAVPVLADRVAAGTPRLITEEDFVGHVLIEARWAKAGSLSLRVRGDSMIPQFREGDLVGASPWKGDPRLLRRKFVVAWLPDDGMTLKQLNLDQTHLILEPLNPAYANMYIDLREAGRISLWRVDWWFGRQQ